jgi:hypothetical protein
MLSSVRYPRRALLALGTAVGAFFVAVATAGVLGQTPEQTGSPDPTPPPASPLAYAEATFNAWSSYDAATLINLPEPAPAQLLLARDPRMDTWSGPSLCEGAAGSYCTWSSDSSQLVLRVANEAASQGQPHAVTEAAFIPTVSGIAIWPFTTQEAADNPQAMANQGHSPWMVNPATVVQFFTGSTLGWQAPVVEPTVDTARWSLTDGATGVVVHVTVSRPARQGFGGIWAVTRLGSFVPTAPASAVP